jgi:hypothetical protein
VVLISYDAPYPEPLNATRPIADGFAVALVLAAADSSSKGALITVGAAGNDAAPTKLADPALESLRRSIPAARSLPLLVLLASDKPGKAVLEYLDGMAISIERA